MTDAEGIRHGRYDLVILADGAASQLRRQVVAARVDRPYAWGAQWCLAEQGHRPWPDQLQQRYVGARRMAGMLPVGSRPDGPVPRMSFVWSLPVAALERESAGRLWGSDLATLWPQAAERLHGVEIPAGLIGACYRDAVHRPSSHGRAVLLGEAAHAMSPQRGQGVNMALLDARALRDALRLRSDIDASLAHYERERRAHVGIYHFWSRWLTPLFQSNHGRIAMLRDRIFHPMSRLPGGRRQMLRVLTGTRRRWFGTLSPAAVFLDVLAESVANRRSQAPR